MAAATTSPSAAPKRHRQAARKLFDDDYGETMKDVEMAPLLTTPESSSPPTKEYYAKSSSDANDSGSEKNHPDHGLAGLKLITSSGLGAKPLTACLMYSLCSVYMVLTNKSLASE
jgi:hypothetical protein